MMISMTENICSCFASIYGVRNDNWYAHDMRVNTLLRYPYNFNSSCIYY